jgi:hypothetical protein
MRNLVRVAAVSGLAIAFGLWVGTAAAEKDTRTVHGTGQTDGQLTVGASERLILGGMPKRLPFQIVVGPAFSSPKCQGDYLCVPEIAERTGGTPPLRTSRRGRAKVFFQMPSGYKRHLIGGPAKPEFIPYEEGDRIRIQANGFTIGKKIQTVGIAVTGGRAHVETVIQPAKHVAGA